MRNNIESALETQEFVSTEFVDKELSKTEGHSVVVKTEDKKAQDFSAGAGLFIIVSLFFMFFLTPVAALISIGFKIDLLPIVIAIMTTTAVVASFYLLLRVIDTSFK